MPLMKQFEIIQHASDEKILRFLDKDGFLRTLGIMLPKMPRQITDINSSFLLRSLDHYRALESHRGDQFENEIITIHPEKNIPLSNRNLNPFFVSCWSHYQNSDLDLPATWEVFPGSIAAIESTVGELKEIIDFLAPTSSEFDVPHAGNWGSIRADATHHGKIIYYSPKDDHHLINDNRVAPLNCFYKRKDPYSQEKEYRFAIMFANHLKFSPEMFKSLARDVISLIPLLIKSTED
jgi:hypothetical protein